MSEKEFDDILCEVRKKAEIHREAANTPTSSNSENVVETTDYSDYLDKFSSNNDRQRPRERSSQPPKKPNNKGNKKGIIIAIVLIVVIAVAGIITGVALSGKSSSDNADKGNDTEVAEVVNPLTGESGYNKSAIGKRPVAIVVENEYSTEAVRPQWALSDADIVLEGECEYSTRLLFMWADYTSVPSMVGPTRSARPPFIRFSQLFDSVFIHAGLSSSKGNYVGADTVFEQNNIDHINLLNLSEDGKFFGRNNDRNTSVEHTAYLNGTNLPELLEQKEIRTQLNSTSFTQFKFNDEVQKVGDITANECSFVFSNGRCPKTAHFTYDTAKHKYVTEDFDSIYGQSGAAFENLLFIFDETEYVVKENYKNGASETYCDYKLAGGRAVLVSEGSAVELTWSISDSKLMLVKADGTDASFNVGKTYIGYGSSNNNGSISFTTPNE